MPTHKLKHVPGNMHSHPPGHMHRPTFYIPQLKEPGIAKIIRRGGPEEMILLVVKHRTHHTCSFSWIVVAIVAWDGMTQETADDLYVSLVEKLTKFGSPRERRCGTNADKTCLCQGLVSEKCGASYSFGCSWSMYHNMCKFARSKMARKFKLADEKAEQEVEDKLQRLATEMAPIYKKYAPEAFKNQVALEGENLECRLGNAAGRPWTGIAACLDFCAHGHKDIHNMNNGCTMVVTLTKHRGFEKPEDEQYHVVPLYVLDPTDESVGYDSFNQKVSIGSLEVLTKYPVKMRLRSEPLRSCRARSLLAKGLPMPKSYRGREPLKNKGKSKAGMIRKSTESSCGTQKLMKFEIKEVGDKLSPDVDFMLKSVYFEDSNDDLSNYRSERDVYYSWLLDFGADYNEPIIQTSNQTDAFPEEFASYFNEDEKHFDNCGQFSSPDKMGSVHNQDPDKCEGVDMGTPYNYTSFSENVENFHDPDIGGVAIALSHRSVLFEYAKHELHATTALKDPNRADPKRLSLVFYHHKTLNFRNHGWTEFERKMKKKKLDAEKLAEEGNLNTLIKKLKQNVKRLRAEAKKDANIKLDS